MGNGEWGMGNGEWGMGSREWGVGSRGEHVNPFLPQDYVGAKHYDINISVLS